MSPTLCSLYWEAYPASPLVELTLVYVRWHSSVKSYHHHFAGYQAGAQTQTYLYMVRSGPKHSLPEVEVTQKKK